MKHLYALLLLSLSLNAQVATDTTTLDNVEIAVRKQSKKITVGEGTRDNAIIQPKSSEWDILGKLIPYIEKYTATPYLKNIEVFTRNRAKGRAKFKVHLYKMGTDSLPAEELVPGGIIATAKRGSKKTTIDLNPYYLTMPKEGLIIAYEWLKLDSNMYPYEGTGKIVDGQLVMAKKSERAMIPAPDIYENEMSEDYGYYFTESWHKFKLNQWVRYPYTYFVPAINVTLSN